MKVGKLVVVLSLGVSAVGLASQAFAQVGDKPPIEVKAQVSEHRTAALKKCVDEFKYGTERYASCMLGEGENP